MSADKDSFVFKGWIYAWFRDRTLILTSRLRLAFEPNLESQSKFSVQGPEQISWLGVVHKLRLQIFGLF